MNLNQDYYKLGGLDVRDQSRSRSRTSIALRLTFENGRDYPSRRDRLLFYLGRDFSVEIYLRRDIYRDRRDKSRSSRQIESFKIFSRIFEISRHDRDFFKTFLRLQAQKSRQIEKS